MAYIVASGRVILLFCFLLLPGGLVARHLGERPPPGWPNLLHPRVGYDLRYAKPIVGAGEKPDVYQQKATYEWTGGRLDRLEVTLVRDPALMAKYSADNLKKEAKPPKEVEIHKRRAWLWPANNSPSERDSITSRLVIMLGSDKAIILEQNYHHLDLQFFAKALDLDKIEKALASPPTR